MPGAILHHLVDASDIDRKSLVQQGTGFVDQFATIATGVRCRLMPLANSGLSDDEKAAQYQSDVSHAVFFLPVQDVQREDILTIRGRKFEVHNFVDDSEGGTVYRKALVFEEQEGP